MEPTPWGLKSCPSLCPPKNLWPSMGKTILEPHEATKSYIVMHFGVKYCGVKSINIPLPWSKILFAIVWGMSLQNPMGSPLIINSSKPLRWNPHHGKYSCQASATEGMTFSENHEIGAPGLKTKYVSASTVGGRKKHSVRKSHEIPRGQTIPKMENGKFRKHMQEERN